MRQSTDCSPYTGELASSATVFQGSPTTGQGASDLVIPLKGSAEPTAIASKLAVPKKPTILAGDKGGPANLAWQDSDSTQASDSSPATPSEDDDSLMTDKDLSARDSQVISSRFPVRTASK